MTGDTAGDEHAAAQIKADRLERERYGPELGAGLKTNGTGPRITERQWQDTVVSTAKMLGWHCHYTTDSRRSPSGWPDLIMWHYSPPRFLIRELKTERGKLSVAQTRMLESLRLAGQDVGVWRPSDWPRVLAELGHVAP